MRFHSCAECPYGCSRAYSQVIFELEVGIHMDEELHGAMESFELWMSIFGLELWDKMFIDNTAFRNRKHGGSVAFFGIN